MLGLAEIELEYRRERQAAGIQVAKKKGSYKRRKKGTTKSNQIELGTKTSPPPGYGAFDADFYHNQGTPMLSVSWGCTPYAVEPLHALESIGRPLGDACSGGASGQGLQYLS